MLSPSGIDPKRVAIYIRWSTDDQGEGTTLETQLERCRYYLGSQGWEFSEELVYVDDGYSGGTLARPALTRLRADVAAARVECVVVYKIDRLSRSVVDIVDLVLREWEGRCYIKSTSEEINTLTPAGKMFFYILVSFAEYERNVIKERTMGGKVKRAEQGLNPGFRLPYGYTKGSAPGSVAIVDHEASVIRRMFAMYAGGNGTGQIAHALNAGGTRRRGELWSQLTVRRILANPAYAGVLEYGRTMRTSREQRERQGLGSVVRFDQPRFARVEGAFPAIVPPALWHEVNQLLGRRSVRQRAGVTRPTYSDYLLSGLATCRCGAPIGGKGAGGHYYYYCTARKRRGASVCDAGHIPVLPANAEIERRVTAVLEQVSRTASTRALEAGLAERHRELEAGAGHVRGRLAAVAERRRRLEADYRSGELPAKLYAKERAALDGEEQQALTDLDILTERIAEMQGVRTDRHQIEAAVNLIRLWDEMTVPERKQVLHKLTAGIRLYRRANSGDVPALELDWIELS